MKGITVGEKSLHIIIVFQRQVLRNIKSLGSIFLEYRNVSYVYFCYLLYTLICLFVANKFYKYLVVKHRKQSLFHC